MGSGQVEVEWVPSADLSPPPRHPHVSGVFFTPPVRKYLSISWDRLAIVLNLQLWGRGIFSVGNSPLEACTRPYSTNPQETP